MLLKRGSLIAGVFALLCISPLAGAITVDGNLADWLEGVPDGTADDWLPKAGVKSVVEDQGRGFLAPGYGGQAYDVEAMYLALDGDALYVAIVTGLSPDTTNYPAGDILIDAGFDPSAARRSFDLAVVVRGHDGYQAGDLVQAESWNYGLWNGDGVLKGSNEATDFYYNHPTTAATGNTVPGNDTLRAEVYYGAARYQAAGGDLDFGNPANVLGGLDDGNHRHYLIEVGIPLSLLYDSGSDLLASPFLVHWNMQCNNDFLELDPPPAGGLSGTFDTGSVPAPPVWLLFLSGLGLIRAARSRG